MKRTDKDTVTGLRTWYVAYAEEMKNVNPQLEDAVTLKYRHTLRVCDEMEQLCDSISLHGNVRFCGMIAALLHDVARFEQFRRYGTFSDKESENHALMGIGIIEKKQLIDILDKKDRSYIITAIRYHNTVSLPEKLTDTELLLCRLLRDADKLDIYRIVLDHYLNPQPQRRDTVQVSIPEGNTVSPEVLQGVRDRKFISYGKIKTVADFKMIQVGWVYDLNFPHSFACVQKRSYLDDLERQLPDIPAIHEVVAAAKAFCEMNAGG